MTVATRRSILVPAVALCLLCAGESPARARDGVKNPRHPDIRVVLLTGFEPFGGGTANASWDAIAPWHGKDMVGVRVICAKIPVVYADAPTALRKAVLRHKPDMIISFGIAPGKAFRLERLARNRDASFAPDNDGVRRAGRVIVPGAPKTLQTSLPLEAMHTALKAGNHGVRFSTDAGGYLCNHLFYHEMHLVKERGIPAGFVHVPSRRTRSNAGGVPLKSIRSGVRAVLRAALWKPALGGDDGIPMIPRRYPSARRSGSEEF